MRYLLTVDPCAASTLPGSPSEWAFRKLKTASYVAMAHTHEVLAHAIATGLDAIIPDDARDWFYGCGCGPLIGQPL